MADDSRSPLPVAGVEVVPSPSSPPDAGHGQGLALCWEYRIEFPWLQGDNPHVSRHPEDFHADQPARFVEFLNHWGAKGWEYAGWLTYNSRYVLFRRPTGGS
jgi:hypothetical protein